MTKDTGDLFSSGTDDTDTNTDHTDSMQNNGDEVAQALQDMIGEGKKYKTQEDALKALVHSQRHISRIETENVEMRASLKDRIALQELLDEIKKAVPGKQTNKPNAGDEMNTDTTQTDQGDNRSGKGNSPKEIDIDTLVNNKITEHETRRTVEANRNKVRDTLVKTYGANYAALVKAEAKQLGLSPESLNELAGKSPEAFFKLLNIKPSAPTNMSGVTPGRSTVGLKTNTGGAAKTYKHFDEIRKTDPARYYSPSVQREMLAMAEQYGDDFYK